MKILSTCFTLLLLLTSTLRGQSAFVESDLIVNRINNLYLIPNTISVVPQGWSADHFVSNNERLIYRIHFQNVGSDTAIDVQVFNRLDLNIFDISTLVVLTSSNSFNFWVENLNTLHWTLLQINLPDSTINEKSSHGYVEFSIKTKPGLPTGTRVENSAEIFFDTNSVTTPVVFNTICETGYPAIMISTLSNFCKGNTAQFVAHGTVEGSSPVYSWYVNNILYANGDSALISGLQNSDVVECILTSSYLCALPSTVRSNRITSTFVNQPVVTEIGGLLFSTPANNYQWYFNNQPLVGETGQSTIPSRNGNYQVQIFDANGCSSTSEVFEFLNTGINIISSEISIYPNPANDHILINGLKNNYTISIHDFSGKTIKSILMKSNSPEHFQIELDDLLPGIYFIRTNSNELAAAKVVVMR